MKKKPDMDVQRLIVRQSSLKAAVDYDHSCSPEDVTKNAQMFYEWVMEKKMEVINETREALISEVKNDEFKEVGKDPF